MSVMEMNEIISTLKPLIEYNGGGHKHHFGEGRYKKCTERSDLCISASVQ